MNDNTQSTSNQVAFCPKCGAKNLRMFKFCQECGQVLPWSKLESEALTPIVPAERQVPVPVDPKGSAPPDKKKEWLTVVGVLVGLCVTGLIIVGSAPVANTETPVAVATPTPTPDPEKIKQQQEAQRRVAAEQKVQEAKAAKEKLRKKKRAKQLLAALNDNTDEVEDITWYQGWSSAEIPMSQTSFHLYFGVTKKGALTPLRMRFQYGSDDWLFIEKYVVKAGEHTFEVKPPTFGVERDNSSGRIWEWYDEKVSDDQIAMIEAVIKNKNVIIRYDGKYFHDYSLEQHEREEIKQVYEAYKAQQL